MAKQRTKTPKPRQATKSRKPQGKAAAPKIAPARPGGRVKLMGLATLVLLVAVALLALGLRRVDGASSVPGLSPGDHVLFERFSAEFGRVAVGEVVTVRARGRTPETVLRRVVAVEGERVAGRSVQRGHLLVEGGTGARGLRLQTVPVGDVMAVARLRIRSKGDRWALDPLSATPRL